MKVTIREMLVVTLAVALMLGWWIDRLNKQLERAELNRTQGNLDEVCRMLERVGLQTKFEGTKITIEGKFTWGGDDP
jgi:hypothetical protein